MALQLFFNLIFEKNMDLNQANIVLGTNNSKLVAFKVRFHTLQHWSWVIMITFNVFGTLISILAHLLKKSMFQNGLYLSLCKITPYHDLLRLFDRSWMLHDRFIQGPRFIHLYNSWIMTPVMALYPAHLVIGHALLSVNLRYK